MPSVSLSVWQSDRLGSLDELESAHRSIGGSGPGRRRATVQINQAYAVLLSSQFQGYCRDLHSESANYLVSTTTSPALRTTFRDVLLQGRKIDRGNPNPSNLGADFRRFGLLFWDEVRRLDLRNQTRQNHLEELNKWRNAIAHQDFDPAILGTSNLQLTMVRRWRNACHQLAIAFDEVMRMYLASIGIPTW